MVGDHCTQIFGEGGGDIGRREDGGECLGGRPAGFWERRCYFLLPWRRSEILTCGRPFLLRFLSRFLGLSRSYSGLPHLQRVRSRSDGGGVQWPPLAIIVTLDKYEPG